MAKYEQGQARLPYLELLKIDSNKERVRHRGSTNTEPGAGSDWVTVTPSSSEVRTDSVAIETA
jgi:hypothetical protein